MKKKIVGLGEVLWDMLPEGKALGGAPCNFAYHACQIPGIEGWGVSAVGDDELGKEILDTLKEKDVNFIIPVIDKPTGTVKVTLDDKGVPNYEICEGVAWDYIPFTPEMEALAKECDAVCFGALAQRNTVSADTIHKFLESVPEKTLKVFDINLRQNFYTKEVIERSLKTADILKINDEEVAVIKDMFGMKELSDEEALRKLKDDFNLKMVVETMGAVGSYVFADGETSWIPTPKVEVADTVGAGDSFTGAFIAELLDGKSIQEAHKKAVEVSAFVCTRHGAMPSYE